MPKRKLQSFMADERDTKALDKIGKEKGLSRSELIRRGMKLYIACHKINKKVGRNKNGERD